MSARKLIKVKPQAFVHDERAGGALAIFESEENKSKFIIPVNTEINVNLFLKESFKRKESGFTLSHDFAAAFGYVVDMALLDKIEEHSFKITLFLRDEKNVSKSLKEIQVEVFELLGLWNTKEFNIFASKEFIESSRDVIAEIPEVEVTKHRQLHKKYGQKYLM